MNNSRCALYIRIIGLLALMLVCVGCSNSVLPDNPGESSEPKEVNMAFTVEYVRYNGPFSIDKLERVYLIDSYEKCIEHLYDFNDLPSRIYEGSTVCIDDLKQRYTESWFANHQLLVVGFLEGSGSNRFNVVELRRTLNNVCIEIERIIPEFFTDNMAYWEVVIEIERCLPKDAEFMLNVQDKGV